MASKSVADHKQITATWIFEERKTFGNNPAEPLQQNFHCMLSAVFILFCMQGSFAFFFISHCGQLSVFHSSLHDYINVMKEKVNP